MDERELDRFYSGKFTHEELEKLGVDFIYSHFISARIGLKTWVSSWNENPDLKAIMEARDEGCDVQVCGDKVEIAKAYREELESSIANIPEECEERIMSMIKRIDEKYKAIFNKCEEEIYITVQRARQRIKKESKFIRDRFTEYEKGYLAFGEKDIKTIQCERAAKWLKSENLKGVKHSISQAALQFGGEIETEKCNGGYKDTNALKTALYKQAADLGIKDFKIR